MNVDTETLNKITREDIPEEYLDIYDAIGHRAFVELCYMSGGVAVYFPKLESLLRDNRNKEIYTRFNGRNFRALARQFHLTERQIRRIIEEQKKERCEK